MAVQFDVEAQFRAELDLWRSHTPGWTERDQLRLFSPHELWARAGGWADSDRRQISLNGDLFRRLMEIAGYIEPRLPGDDGRLPCGWPR